MDYIIKLLRTRGKNSILIIQNDVSEIIYLKVSIEKKDTKEV
jgi:hypothetical protein